MSMERMWDMASMISAIAGLFVSAILVARFYISYVIKKKVSFLTGIVFFAIMIFDRRNISQKVFLSMTIYMFLWIAQAIAALPWKLISNFTYARYVEIDLQCSIIMLHYTYI